MDKINKAWHEANAMPKNPRFAQRVAWHREHAGACGCRAVRPSIAATIAAEDSAQSAA